MYVSLDFVYVVINMIIRIRIRMSFIGQVCLHIRGICYSDKAPQCNRMTATGQDTDNKEQYTNIQIGNVLAKTLCNTDNHVCPGLTCKFEMEKKLNKKYYMCGE